MAIHWWALEISCIRPAPGLDYSLAMSSGTAGSLQKIHLHVMAAYSRSFVGRGRFPQMVEVHVVLTQEPSLSRGLIIGRTWVSPSASEEKCHYGFCRGISPFRALIRTVAFNVGLTSNDRPANFMLGISAYPDCVYHLCQTSSGIDRELTGSRP